MAKCKKSEGCLLIFLREEAILPMDHVISVTCIVSKERNYTAVLDIKVSSMRLLSKCRVSPRPVRHGPR
jgi:hypothetical protein